MKKYHLWIWLIISIGLALRLHNLTYHSLWFDEAVSVYWARQSLPRILEVGFTLVEDRLPPLYYLTLKGWAAIFDFSEFSVRLPSVFYGVLLIPATASLATMLFNRRVALFAALLVTFNPFLIWYSQEARMYAPAVLFGALTVWAFLQLVKTTNHNRQEITEQAQFTAQNSSQPSTMPRDHSRFTLHASRFTILFILFAVAGLYSHLYSGFLLPALGLWLIISYPRRRRLWLWFGLSSLMIVAAFAPVAVAIWRFSGETTPGDPLSGFWQRIWWLLQAFTVWKAPLSPLLQPALPLILAFFAGAAYLKPINSELKSQIANHKPAGRVSQIVNRKPAGQVSQIAELLPHPRLLITLLLVAPFLIANLLLFRNQLAFFGERYFIVMVPWLLLLAALGADNLGKWASLLTPRFSLHAPRSPLPAPHSPLPFLLLLLVTVLPIPGQWSIPAAKEAWRQSVAYLAEQARPDHAILIHPDWVRHPFQFYFQGPGQTYAAFSSVTPETPIDGPLAGVVDDHPVIWLIQSHWQGADPNRRVEQWLAGRYPLVTELYPPGISLTAYVPGYRFDSLPPEASPVDIQFGNGLRLVGYQADPIVTATDALFHPPSGWLHVTLYWTATRPVGGDTSPYLELVGPEGVWGKSLTRTNDALNLYPPAQWPAAAGRSLIIRHDVDVNLNPVTPPGRYQLVIGLAGAKEQHRLAEIEVR